MKPLTLGTTLVLTVIWLGCSGVREERFRLFDELAAAGSSYRFADGNVIVTDAEADRKFRQVSRALVAEAGFSYIWLRAFVGLAPGTSRRLKQAFYYC